MPTRDPAEIAQAKKGRLHIAKLLWFKVKDRSDPTIVHREGYWDGGPDVSIQVINPSSGSTITRNYFSDRGIISIPPLPRVLDGSIPRIKLRLNGLDQRVADLIRFWEPRFGEVEIHEVWFDPLDPYRAFAPAQPRFIGIIDEVDIYTGEEGGAGHVQVEVVGIMQEANRSYTYTRSDADQRKHRLSSDRFFKDVETWDEDHAWGARIGKVPAERGGSRPARPSVHDETNQWDD